MLSNTIATCQSRCRAQAGAGAARGTSSFTIDSARSRAPSCPYVDVLRNAIAFAIGSIEARMGLASATAWIELLEKDILQQVNALLLRKVLALQVGDAEGAERYRREAELLALQARVRQMFTTTAPTELAAHALAGDLSGVQQVKARIQALAEALPGLAALRGARGRPVPAAPRQPRRGLRGLRALHRDDFARSRTASRDRSSPGRRPSPAISRRWSVWGATEEAKSCGEQRSGHVPDPRHRRPVPRDLSRAGPGRSQARRLREAPSRDWTR